MTMVTLIQKPLVLSIRVEGHSPRRISIPTNSSSPPVKQTGKRALMSSIFLAFAAALPEASDSRTSLLQKYLKKSKENKSKNDKERLEDYYKRNYRDYFEFVEGSLNGKTEGLSEAEKGPMKAATSSLSSPTTYI